jgi:hypothetical protein
MDLEDVMLGGVDQAHKEKYSIISLTYGILKTQIYRSGWLPQVEENG